MPDPEGKRVQDSYVEQVHVVEPQYLNHMQTFSGGQLMAWMDIIGAAASALHSGRGVTMVGMDELQIMSPARLGDRLVYQARLTNVGRTSMEVFVGVDIEDAEKNRRRISEAYVMMVALDDDGRPATVPPLIIETDEERKLWDAAEERKERRNSRRAR
jgi:acyl-CoA hydrolase